MTRAPALDELLEALARASVGELGHRIDISDGDPDDPLVQLALATNILLSDLEHQQRQLADANARLERQVEERTRELRLANQALARTNQSLEAFSYVVSHDLKEPVRGILALAEELTAKDPVAPPEDLLPQLEQASRRLARMVEGLLEFSRAALHTHIRPEVLEVHEELEDEACRGRYADAAERTGARIEVEPGPAVFASAPALHQLLGNLVLNGITHNARTPPHVRVVVRLADDPRCVDVVVEDDGPGFPDIVLEAFRKTSGDRPSTLRGGFGLAIARRAAEHMGGRLVLGRSEALGGAAVTARLPRAVDS